VKPLELGPNQIRRFYRGGARIAAFRGLPSRDDSAPEDWVASTTTVFGDDEVGLSRLENGRRLADLFPADPETYFERAHLAAYGADPAVLIKLLDAGERLPVHLHPDGPFAQSHLGTPHGKTEAWVVLDAEPDACVHVGFGRDVEEDELEAMIESQDVDAMLAAMNRLPVSRGDTIYVPAGLAHAIGEGILLLELQEPSDLSLLLEWRGLSEADAYLGLSRETALAAVRRSPLSAAELERLTLSRDPAIFPPEADRFFRAELLAEGSVLEPAFSVVIVYDGEGALETDYSGPVALRRGSTVVVPFAAGTCAVTGACRAIRCRPPAP
jgi:mannose-6-phosphate isomerase